MCTNRYSLLGNVNYFAPIFVNRCRVNLLIYRVSLFSVLTFSLSAQLTGDRDAPNTLHLDHTEYRVDTGVDQKCERNASLPRSAAVWDPYNPVDQDLFLIN